MPSLPNKFCTFPGCGTIVKKGRCGQHIRKPRKERQAAYQRRNKNFQSMYNYKWAQYSRGRLVRYPLCVECKSKGMTRAAEVTDHITPHKGDRRLFWDGKNHQSLCKACHDTKTAKEGAFGRKDLV